MAAAEVVKLARLKNAALDTIYGEDLLFVR